MYRCCETYSFWPQAAEVFESFHNLFRVFYLDSQIIFVFAILFSEICRVLVESSLTAYPNGGIEIKGQFVPLRSSRFRLDERIQSGPVGCLGIAVEEEGGVIWIR